MVSYVMDGKVSNAMKSVLARIRREKGPLRVLNMEWDVSAFVPAESHIRQTRHEFTQPARKTFCFQHVFLAV
jgi:hypothetical protein